MIELAKLELSDGFRKAEKGKNVKALKLKLICSAQKLQGIATNPASTILTEVGQAKREKRAKSQLTITPSFNSLF